ANFGRDTEALPLDAGIRSLSAEYDFPTTNWTTPNDGAGHALINPDGTIDFSHFSIANNSPAFFGGVSAQDFSHAFGKGTRSEYLDEYVVGFEHEFGNSGVIFSARYTDRRIKRIIEDNAELSVEEFQGATPDNPNCGNLPCFFAQNYFISNPNKSQDLFKNPVQIDYNSADGPPATCTSAGTNLTLYADPVFTAGFTNGPCSILDRNVKAVLANGNDAMCDAPAFTADRRHLTAMP